MSELSRRSFLGGCAALAGAGTVRAKFRDKPRALGAKLLGNSGVLGVIYPKEVLAIDLHTARPLLIEFPDGIKDASDGSQQAFRVVRKGFPDLPKLRDQWGHEAAELGLAVAASVLLKNYRVEILIARIPDRKETTLTFDPSYQHWSDYPLWPNYHRALRRYLGKWHDLTGTVHA